MSLNQPLKSHWVPSSGHASSGSIFLLFLEQSEMNTLKALSHTWQANALPSKCVFRIYSVKHCSPEYTSLCQVKLTLWKISDHRSKMRGKCPTMEMCFHDLRHCFSEWTSSCQVILTLWKTYHTYDRQMPYHGNVFSGSKALLLRMHLFHAKWY